MTHLSREDWLDFVGLTLESRHADLTATEYAKPGCNDEPDPGEDAPTIVSRFWTDRDLDDLKWFVNPLSWPDLGSLYWEEMAPVNVVTGDVKAAPYEATFRERVRLPVVGTVTVHLDVTYTVGSDHALTVYRTTRDPAFPNPFVVQDEGCVHVTSQTGPQGLPYEVFSTKKVRFVDRSLDQYLDLTCDNGWVDLMMRMALSEPGAAHAPHEQGPMHEAEKPPDALAAWGNSATALVQQKVDLARKTVSAVQSGYWNDGLLNDYLGFGDELVDTVTLGAKAWREVVRALAQPGDNS